MKITYGITNDGNAGIRIENDNGVLIDLGVNLMEFRRINVNDKSGGIAIRDEDDSIYTGIRWDANDTEIVAPPFYRFKILKSPEYPRFKDALVRWISYDRKDAHKKIKNKYIDTQHDHTFFKTIFEAPTTATKSPSELMGVD